MMRSVLLYWLAAVRGSARVFTSSCVGPPQPAVVSQDYYVSANGQKVFRAENLLTRNTAGETVADLWFPPSDKQQGEFVLDLGCVGRLAGAELVNTHNRQYRDRSTRAFTLATALTYTGPWTQVLSQELENSRQQVDPLPLQTFAFSAVARFVKFKIVSWHDDASAGGGLQYFFPILESKYTVGGAGRKVEVFSSSTEPVRFQEVEPVIMETADIIAQSQATALNSCAITCGATDNCYTFHYENTECILGNI